MSDIITFPFDPNRTPREQIEIAVAAIQARVCERHPHEILPVDKAATIRNALFHECPNENEPRRVEFTATFERCSKCPHNCIDHHNQVERCAVGIVLFGSRDICTRDEQGRPLPTQFGNACFEADRSARQQFDAWLANAAEFGCSLGNQVLRRRGARIISPSEMWTILPEFIVCPQCRLERLGVTPDEAQAAFSNFLVDPPALKQHLDVCRAFAATPKGVLVLLGNCGTGKTHLAVAILRERLRQGVCDLRFVKHRHFLAEHWHSLRPVAFREKQPESPLARCRAAELLVYDELTSATDSRSYEDVLLDLFEHRIGHFKPCVITANVTHVELEAALGTRLFDRLRRASFALLEFGFDSKRPNFNTDYLDRTGKP
jgi:DNA replication protein DnaC